MVEEEVRAAFARHEHLTPAAGPLREAIDRVTVRRRRRRLVVRAAGAVLAVLAVVLPGYGLRLAAEDRPAIEDVTSTGPERGALDGPLDVLVLGLDTGERRAARADMVLVAHIPADRSGVYLLSFPRDLLVTVPPSEAAGYPGGTDKLSAVFHYGSLRPGGASDRAGGARLTRAALTGLTGLEFDAVVTVEFSALLAMTDQVGGVGMCLDRRVDSVHTGRRFPAGCQHLDGRAALDLLRQRRDLPDGTLSRDEHGRQYLTALLTAARSGGVFDDVLRAHRLLRAAGDGLVIDPGRGDVAGLLWALRGIEAGDVVGVALPVSPTGPGLWLADTEQASALFRAFSQDRADAWLASNPAAAD